MNLKTSALILFALSGAFLLASPAKDACAQVTISPNPSSGGATVVIGTSSGPSINLPIPGLGSSSGSSSSSSGGTSTPTGSGQIAQQTCDSQVWATMENRARLETEREMMQNQNLIFKADSVLSYTCFDSFAAHAAKNVGVLFTHTTYFTGAEIIPWSTQNSMDYAMEKAVVDSMKAYLLAKPDDLIDGNFDHSYLGDRGKFLGLSDPLRPKINSVPQGGGNYECDVMAEVWKKAKCMNFMHTNDFKNTDGYYPFIDLKDLRGASAISGYETIKDTRQFPKDWDCSGKPFIGEEWMDMYRHSRNERGPFDPNYYYQYGSPIQLTYEAVRKLVEPAGTCGAAIPTGVQVILGPGLAASKYADGICTNPGCSYKKNGKCEPN